MSKNFERKAYSREEINIIVAEQMGLAIEPICREIGQVMEGFNARLKDLEAAVNATIEEMKESKRRKRDDGFH